MDKKLQKILDDKKIHMLTQPLLTEEGFINEACMNELAAAVNNMPESYERLASNPEWTLKVWTSWKEICGAFAMWAVRLFGGAPPNMEDIIAYLKACLTVTGPFAGAKNDYGFVQLSLCEINKLLWDYLGDCSRFQDWNKEAIVGKNWIDLSALLHNVCVTIRDERRHRVAFDVAFDARYDEEK